MESQTFFCLSLATGATIVAGVQIFLSGSGLLNGVIVMQNKEYIINNLPDLTKWDPHYRESFTTCEYRSYNLDDKTLSMVLDLEVVLYVAIALNVINIITDICLIFGAVRV